MTKLCPRGKAAAKRKFKVYPSAYANAYASKICAGKAKDPSGVKRKDWGPKKMKTGGDTDIKKYGNQKKDRMKTKPYGIEDRKIKIEKLSAQKKKPAGIGLLASPPTTPLGKYYHYDSKDYSKNKPKKTRKASGGEIKIKKVIKGLNKASKTHAKQAKTLKTIKVRGGGMAMQGMNFKGVF
jgi:hypothetical protein